MDLIFYNFPFSIHYEQQHNIDYVVIQKEVKKWQLLR